MAEAVIQEYSSSLKDLTINSKPLINMLTMLAEDHESYASDVVQVIESHIAKAQPPQKLSTLYLIDSIVKNLRETQYLQLFNQNIVRIFCSVFEKVDEKTRQAMFKLRQTWGDIFSNRKLYTLDVKVNNMDPAWPIAPLNRQTASIHVNPKFLKQNEKSIAEESVDDAEFNESSAADDKDLDGDGQETLMRQQLIAKQQELLKIQQQKLELELAETMAKLKQKQPNKSPTSSKQLDSSTELQTKITTQRANATTQAMRDPRLANRDPRMPSQPKPKIQREIQTQHIEKTPQLPHGIVNQQDPHQTATFPNNPANFANMSQIGFNSPPYYDSMGFRPSNNFYNPPYMQQNPDYVNSAHMDSDMRTIQSNQYSHRPFPDHGHSNYGPWPHDEQSDNLDYSQPNYSNKIRDKSYQNRLPHKEIKPEYSNPDWDYQNKIVGQSSWHNQLNRQKSIDNRSNIPNINKKPPSHVTDLPSPSKQRLSKIPSKKNEEPKKVIKPFSKVSGQQIDRKGGSKMIEPLPQPVEPEKPVVTSKTSAKKNEPVPKNRRPSIEKKPELQSSSQSSVSKMNIDKTSNRDVSKKNDGKKIDPIKDDSKRENSKRGNSKRGNSKRDDTKNDSSKRDELKRDVPKKNDSKRRDNKSRNDNKPNLHSQDKYSRSSHSQSPSRSTFKVSAKKSQNSQTKSDQSKSITPCPKTSTVNAANVKPTDLPDMHQNPQDILTELMDTTPSLSETEQLFFGITEPISSNVDMSVFEDIKVEPFESEEIVSEIDTGVLPNEDKKTVQANIEKQDQQIKYQNTIMHSYAKDVELPKQDPSMECTIPEDSNVITDIHDIVNEVKSPSPSVDLANEAKISAAAVGIKPHISKTIEVKHPSRDVQILFVPVKSMPESSKISNLSTENSDNVVSKDTIDIYEDKHIVKQELDDQIIEAVQSRTDSQNVTDSQKRDTFNKKTNLELKNSRYYRSANKSEDKEDLDSNIATEVKIEVDPVDASQEMDSAATEINRENLVTKMTDKPNANLTFESNVLKVENLGATQDFGDKDLRFMKVPRKRDTDDGDSSQEPIMKKSRPSQESHVVAADDLSDLFGKEDVDYRIVPQVMVSPETQKSHAGWAKYKADHSDDVSSSDVDERVHKTPSDVDMRFDTDLRQEGFDRERRFEERNVAPDQNESAIHVDTGIVIPEELSLKKQKHIIMEADRLAHEGKMSHDEHQNMLRQLDHVYSIQRQRKERRLSEHHSPTSPPRVFRDGTGRLRMSGRRDRALEEHRQTIDEFREDRSKFRHQDRESDIHRRKQEFDDYNDYNRSPHSQFPDRRSPQKLDDGYRIPLKRRPYEPNRPLRPNMKLPLPGPPVPPSLQNKYPEKRDDRLMPEPNRPRGQYFVDQRWLKDTEIFGFDYREEVVIDNVTTNFSLSGPPRIVNIRGIKHRISFNERERAIELDREIVYRLGELVKEVVIDGNLVKFYYHGPQKLLWLNKLVFQVRVDAPPQIFHMDDKKITIQIDGKDMMILIDRVEKGHYGGPPRKIRLFDRDYDLQFEPPSRQILIDQKKAEILLNRKVPVVMIDDQLYGIGFLGDTVDVNIDGKVYPVPVDHCIKVRLGLFSRPHWLGVGGPTHEVIIDNKWLEVAFCGPPRTIQIGTRKYKISLPNERPGVKIIENISPECADINPMYRRMYGRFRPKDVIRPAPTSELLMDTQRDMRSNAEPEPLLPAPRMPELHHIPEAHNRPLPEPIPPPPMRPPGHDPRLVTSSADHPPISEPVIPPLLNPIPSAALKPGMPILTQQNPEHTLPAMSQHQPMVSQPATSIVPPMVQPGQPQMLMPGMQPMMMPRQPIISQPGPMMISQSGQPMIQPGQPMMQPSQPMMQPSQPMIPSAQPMIPSAQPMIQPGQPIMQSSQPMVQPGQSIVAPMQQQPMISMPNLMMVTPQMMQPTMMAPQPMMVGMNAPAASVYHPSQAIATSGIATVTQPQPSASNLVVPAASVASAPVFDVAALFSKLVNAGIFKKIDKPEETAISEVPTVAAKTELTVPPVSDQTTTHNDDDDDGETRFEEVPDLTDLKLEMLKMRFEGTIQRLYDGIQCSSCGTRFRMSDTERYREHLDWHFRSNKTNKDETRVAKYRKWYFAVGDWIQFEELEDADVKRRSAVFEKAEADRADTPDATVAMPRGDGIIQCPVSSGNGDCCVICGDQFETSWDDEHQEWHLRDAIQVSGKNYHPVCYEDANDETSSNQSSPVSAQANYTTDFMTAPVLSMVNYEQAQKIFERDREIPAIGEAGDVSEVTRPMPGDTPVKVAVKLEAPVAQLAVDSIKADVGTQPDVDDVKPESKPDGDVAMSDADAKSIVDVKPDFSAAGDSTSTQDCGGIMAGTNREGDAGNIAAGLNVAAAASGDAQPMDTADPLDVNPGSVTQTESKSVGPPGSDVLKELGGSEQMSQVQEVVQVKSEPMDEATPSS